MKTFLKLKYNLFIIILPLLSFIWVMLIPAPEYDFRIAVWLFYILPIVFTLSCIIVFFKKNGYVFNDNIYFNIINIAFVASCFIPYTNQQQLPLVFIVFPIWIVSHLYKK